MAKIGTVKLSDLMSWGVFMKKEHVQPTPDPNDVKATYEKALKMIENTSEKINLYIKNTIIKYGEQTDDMTCNHFEMYMGKTYIDAMDNDVFVDGIKLKSMDISEQMELLEKVMKHVKKLTPKNVVDYKF